MVARRRSNVPIVAWVALGAVWMLVVALLTPVVAQAQDVTPARVDGETRFHTAANVATLTFDQADVAHIAFGGDFPDALAASFGAGSVDGPILLSERDHVPEPTLAALEALGVEQVVLVGGTQVLSADVAATFGESGYDVARISGADRHETAAAVALQYGQQFGVGEIDGQRTAVLASGANFPDALSVGPIVASLGLPLLLTPAGSTHAVVNSTLEDLDIERVVVVGGSAAVSSDVVLEYEAAGYDVERWGGETRTDTARIVADQALARFGFTADLTLLARGDNFPDALAASIHGGVNNAPLLLSATPGSLSSPTARWLRAACPDIGAVRAIGGTAAIAVGTLANAVSAAQWCIEPEDTIGPASTEDRQSDPFPGEDGVAQLVEVRAAQHDGFDRVVFEFEGPEQPGWFTRLDTPPAVAAGSGEPVPVEGEAYIDLGMSFAVARYIDGTYDGPDRIAVGGGIVTEVVLTGDFEAQLEWAIGLENEAPYAIGILDSPVRVVVDVLHE